MDRFLSGQGDFQPSADELVQIFEKFIGLEAARILTSHLGYGVVNYRKSIHLAQQLPRVKKVGKVVSFEKPRRGVTSILLDVDELCQHQVGQMNDAEFLEYYKDLRKDDERQKSRRHARKGKSVGKMRRQF